MNKTRDALALAVASTLGAAGAADAATYTATLTGFTAYSNNGAAAANLSSSTATWSYDDATNLASQTGGTFNARFGTSPTATLYRLTTTGLVVGNGAAATASTFACQEGNFGPSVIGGFAICGNYSFGSNFVDETTMVYGPGTAAVRTLGGDDAPLGPPIRIQDFNTALTVSWVGTTLTLSNANQFQTKGYSWVFEAGPQVVVPVPAAVWLFGSALGLLGVARRRVTA
jgi:hypothetical protein